LKRLIHKLPDVASQKTRPQKSLPLSPLTDLDVADPALEVLVSFLDVVDSPLETFLDVTILAPHFLNL